MYRPKKPVGRLYGGRDVTTSECELLITRRQKIATRFEMAEATGRPAHRDPTHTSSRQLEAPLRAIPCTSVATAVKL